MTCLGEEQTDYVIQSHRFMFSYFGIKSDTHSCNDYYLHFHTRKNKNSFCLNFFAHYILDKF